MEFHALRQIVLTAFGAVDQPVASCMLVRFLEIKFTMIVGLPKMPLKGPIL